jgi:hypothetical protein
VMVLIADTPSQPAANIDAQASCGCEERIRGADPDSAAEHQQLCRPHSLDMSEHVLVAAVHLRSWRCGRAR